MRFTPADATAAYPPSARLAAAALTVIAKGSPLLLLVLLLFFETRLSNQLRLIRTFASVCLAPGLAAWLLRRTFAASLRVEHGALVVARRAERVEVPVEAIAAVEPWTVPLPASGVSLRLRSGTRFRWGLAVPDPVHLGDALRDAGANVDTPARRSGAARYASAKHAARRWWQHPLFKYVVFGLVPALPVFRLHQWIAYGGTFGEYYTYGLQAYLLALAIYWGTFIVYLVCYGALLRAVAEVIALAVAYTAPGRARAARTAVERAVALLYFGAVPAFLVRLFLQS